MAQIAPLVNALVELMTAKDALAAKQNDKSTGFNQTRENELRELQNKVVAAQAKVNQAAQMFQGDLDRGLIKP